MEDEESPEEDAAEGGEATERMGPGAEVDARSKLRELTAIDSGPGAELERRSSGGNAPGAIAKRKRRSAQRTAIAAMLARQEANRDR